MWRPKNWENPYSLKHFPHYDDADGDLQDRITSKYYLYEAGADAILEALGKIGKRLPDKRGWLVFIPDEEQAMDIWDVTAPP